MSECILAEDILKNCKKIGIMGGTFNPIHVGHLLMARWALEFAGLHAILFVPTGNSYMKEASKILPGEVRLSMIRQSIRNEPDFFVSDIEIARAGNTYTCQTLRELRNRYPDAALYFIAGSDCLFSLEKWLHPEQILSDCTLIAAARNGAVTEELEAKKRELMNRFGGRILLMEFPSIDISSTMIRERVKAGKSIRYLTTDVVCDTIEANGYYQ